MDQKEARERLEDWARSVERSGWRPVIDDKGGPSSSISRFCGEPWVLDGEDVPACKACGRELQQLLQLDLEQLPADFTAGSSRGVVQLFYCIGGETSDEYEACCGDGGWEPFSTDVKITRLVAKEGLGPIAANSDVLPAQVIASWELFYDRPGPQDHQTAGLRRRYDFKAKTITLEAESVGVRSTFGIDELPVEKIANAAAKDKLGGWPDWIQGAEYPTCPTCGQQMQVIFQVDSEDHVPFTFGDAGIGHISMCRSHPEIVAFGWACG